MAFPETHRSAVLAVRSRDEQERARALEAVVAAYWRPVYRHLRARWRAREDEAEDLAQGFFAAALEKGWLARYEPARGPLPHAICSPASGASSPTSEREGRRLKRGGGATLVPLESEDADGEPRELQLDDGSDLEADFQREWARGLFALAVEALRRRCLGTSRRGGASGSSSATTSRTSMRRSGRATPTSRRSSALPVTQVTNHLHWARQELRETVLETLREITASEEEFRSEARALFGAEPS